MPGLRTDSPAFQYYNAYKGTAPGFTSLPPGIWYGYQTRTDNLQTTEFANISFDFTDKLSVEAGAVHFKSDFSYYSPYGQFAYVDTSPALSVGSSAKWNGKFGLNYHFSHGVMAYANCGYLRAQQFQRQCRRCAHPGHRIESRLQVRRALVGTGLGQLYRLTPEIEPVSHLPGQRG